MPGIRMCTLFWGLYPVFSWHILFTIKSIYIKESTCAVGETLSFKFSSVQFSRSVVSDSTPGLPVHHQLLELTQTHVHLSSRWCHPTILSSVIPFSSCLQSFPASGTFPVSQFFPSGGQRIGISASASVLLMNIWDWFPLWLTGLIPLQF